MDGCLACVVFRHAHEEESSAEIALFLVGGNRMYIGGNCIDMYVCMYACVCF